MSDLGDLKLTPEMLEALRASGSRAEANPFGPCLCGSLLEVRVWQRKFHSGRWHDGNCVEPGVNYTDLLCDDCRRQFKSYPRIVCLGCRSLMGFVTPGKEKTGFEFVRNRHYHIVECPRCNPHAVATAVLEHEKFCKERGIPTQTNYDLLQEIEQKTLQGKAAADKLRAEFDSSASE